MSDLIASDSKALETNDLVGALASRLEHPLSVLRVTTAVDGNADAVAAASVLGANLAGTAVGISVAFLV